MKASELHDKTPDQLRDELVNLKKESFNLRFQQATGQLENPARLKTVKRDACTGEENYSNIGILQL